MAATLVAFAGLGSAANAADEKPDIVTAVVAPGSKTDPKGTFYALDAAPGSSTTQTVVVSNDQAHPIVARVEGVDAGTGNSTGASYDPPGTEPSATGAWIVVATPEVTLQPGEKRPVDFTVHVPQNASPGVYLAGLSASVPRTDEAATTTTAAAPRKGAAFQVTLQAQRIIAVKVTVPGPATPKLVVTGARATATPDGVALLIGMENRGNAFAHGTGTITVADTGLHKRFTIDTFVSHTKIEYRVPWTSDVVTGDHPIAVQLRYEGGRQTTWNGTVAISRGVGEKLASDLRKTRLPEKGGLPWLLIGGGAAVALCCAAGVVVLRRRRQATPAFTATVS